MPDKPDSTPDDALVPGLRVSAWSPGEDVIEVTRNPKPGAAPSAWRTFRETARGMRTTFARLG